VQSRKRKANAIKLELKSLIAEGIYGIFEKDNVILNNSK